MRVALSPTVDEESLLRTLRNSDVTLAEFSHAAFEKKLVYVVLPRKYVVLRRVFGEKTWETVYTAITAETAALKYSELGA